MKTKELYLLGVLYETIGRQIFPTDDEYSRFDAYDLKDNIYELKVRGAYYEDTLIEFDKFSFNLMYAKTFGKRFLYVVQMDDMGYVFDISALYNEGYDFRWQTLELPKHTEFTKKEPISKVAGYISIENTIFAFKVL
tara:strand:+ start:919 stop:1329 length:411 start_codon:yes stop_codon:yes gene_type:complete